MVETYNEEFKVLNFCEKCGRVITTYNKDMMKKTCSNCIGTSLDEMYNDKQILVDKINYILDYMVNVDNISTLIEERRNNYAKKYINWGNEIPRRGELINNLTDIEKSVSSDIYIKALLYHQQRIKQRISEGIVGSIIEDSDTFNIKIDLSSLKLEEFTTNNIISESMFFSGLQSLLSDLCLDVDVEINIEEENNVYVTVDCNQNRYRGILYTLLIPNKPLGFTVLDLKSYYRRYVKDYLIPILSEEFRNSLNNGAKAGDTIKLTGAKTIIEKNIAVRHLRGRGYKTGISTKDGVLEVYL